MTKLSDFPPDVQAIALQTYDRRPITVAGIAQAIMADRQARLSTAGLTQRQADCLAFIDRHQRDNGGLTPTFDEIKDALGLASKSGICRLLDGLEDRGRIRRLPNRSRAITIIASQPVQEKA